MTACDVDFSEAGPSDAPVLLLSNSLGSTQLMWEPQRAALAEHFRVISYDHRGHGRSPAPDGPYEIADLGGDVLALLDRLGVATASFCGLSLGGMVGIWLGANAPDRIERLALCATSACLGPPEAWAERAAAVLAHGTASIAATVVGRWFTPAYAAANPAVVTQMIDMVSSASATGYAACCGAIERMDQRGDLPAIIAPTLVIAAAGDPSTPPVHGAAIAAGIPGARMVVIPDAAHLVNVAQADSVTALLVEHLSGGT